ncbi:hypothetical protein A2962_05455 [Candidatus Woesebacteria bacterium RIFCSPLOWO2_01_FULL_39_61]|uniref:Uncharacterized protein n=1 Tax=Candidatus Woesebacteria bacterium RIFCSPHIGHO2_02_FULL_39_13 TaxID=1802505 RepID=A0A1F7Z5A4_9BACT|nr:MAG: hypothetical protein A2692_00770 [Candidatus Woesebacteria bacterium RIFCSPHIGHO2_01_FULL_39_95]OGM34654.1 MAG: hypothetical protein A3D01_06460 [Candidatus Woesebacteria bacterium RIFCSPHIGHO2_02_FULL_39_13]OGM37396.1 MAG: hypothetical protein A3E13_05490 [Candidatus Woesebacteria bacterium RIFCSPHIGHO2_12_FULL_40_20]OGM68362.1 MAG: hypothetical protein A2962_05455 [Candidatus Woesebacteria bacterium RIFCSPLOWO2_01_FULL_39_61]OGM71894.1 MAG: hypothetical protein A3H19_05455 [Candidatus
MIAIFQGTTLNGVSAWVDLDSQPAIDTTVGVLQVGWVMRNNSPVKNPLDLAHTIMGHRYRVLSIQGGEVSLFAFSNGVSR